MIVDLKFDSKYVVIIGGGNEAYRRTMAFLDAGSRILVASRSFSSGIKKLYQTKKIDLLETGIKDAEAFINQLRPKPDLLVAATNDQNLNVQLAKHAKSAGCIVYVTDNPSISDFILPALAKVGEVTIAISTSGKSPAMAKVLRQRVERMITREDLLQIKLQNYARTILKQRISEQKVRKKILYKILRDDHVKRLLKEEKFDEAEEVATRIIESFVANHKSQKGASAIAGQSLQEEKR
jgi:precorrin-2 dehydrogenase/sirohydrochlorin ferrochelatase